MTDQHVTLLLEAIRHLDTQTSQGFAAVNHRLDIVNGTVGRHKEKIAVLEAREAVATTNHIDCRAEWQAKVAELETQVRAAGTHLQVTRQVAALVAGTVSLAAAIAAAVGSFLR